MRGRMPPRASARQLVFEPAKPKDWKAVDPEPDPAADVSFEHIQPQAAERSDGQGDEDDEDDVADDDDDKTVMIRAQPLSEPEGMEDEVTFELPAAPSLPPAVDDGTQPSSRKQKFKITEEMEVVIVSEVAAVDRRMSLTDPLCSLRFGRPSGK